MMPFKEGVTKNIYNQWKGLIYPDAIGIISIPCLSDYALEELNQLKWLIEQQINCLQNHV